MIPTDNPDAERGHNRDAYGQPSASEPFSVSSRGDFPRSSRPSYLTRDGVLAALLGTALDGKCVLDADHEPAHISAVLLGVA